MSEPILAIDFGTSNSLVGAFVDGEKRSALSIDPSSSDPTLMRTLLYFANAKTCFYGEKALVEYAAMGMEGRLFRSFKTHLPNRDYLGTFVEDRVLTLDSMIGIFLLELKKRSEAIIGESITTAVIGRPARYSMDPIKDNFALHRMTKAVEFAGFQDFVFVPEPLAAAFDYRRNQSKEKLVLVGDFGGGTSDFTVMRIGPRPFVKEDVLGIDGCPLAGDALDSLFMSKRLNTHFGSKSKYRMLMGSNILTMPPTVSERLNQPAHIAHLKDRETYAFIQQVRKCSLTDTDRHQLDQLCALVEDDQIFSFFESIEQTKRLLSTEDSADFRFEYPGIQIEESFKRTDFDGWSEDIQQRILSSLDSCLAQAQVTPKDIDVVYLTGGTAQVPSIRRAFIERFGQAKLTSQSTFHSVLSGLVESAELVAEGRWT